MCVCSELSDVKKTSPTWQVGAAATDWTPTQPRFLFGYPGVERTSTGVHDPLLASAMVVRQQDQTVAWVGCDVIFIPKDLAQRARRRIEAATSIPADHIMITATHTHSGPNMTAMLSNANDAIVPLPATEDLQRLEDAIVHSVSKATATLTLATLRFAEVDGSMLGSNRHDPAGPSIARVPVLIAERADDQKPIGVMCVVSMHPTVLHEDWTQYSGDFPGLARQWLQHHVVGPDCPLVYHAGACGNQSPRHAVKANTIEEAHRLGEALGRQLQQAVEQAKPVENATLEVLTGSVTLPVRTLPSVAEAKEKLEQASQKLEDLKQQGAPRAVVRTAECDCFGAEETLTLARANESGGLQEAAQSCMPGEIQVVRIGGLCFVGWPGEVFVEFALDLQKDWPNVCVITLANGELQGYLVTQQAIDIGAYEAGNAIFQGPDAGWELVAATRRLLEQA